MAASIITVSGLSHDVRLLQNECSQRLLTFYALTSEATPTVTLLSKMREGGKEILLPSRERDREGRK
jgi:hypothetical protein